MSAPARKIEHCRSCRAPVVWLRHPATGKTAPIDAEPSPDGTILVDAGRGTYQIGKEPARGNFPGLLHTNHFATCPQAAAWHKRGA